jgi:hypothetical protein
MCNKLLVNQETVLLSSSNKINEDSTPDYEVTLILYYSIVEEGHVDEFVANSIVTDPNSE